MVFRVPPAVMKIALTLASLNLRRSSGFLLILLSRVTKSQFLPSAPIMSKIGIFNAKRHIRKIRVTDVIDGQLTLTCCQFSRYVDEILIDE